MPSIIRICLNRKVVNGRPFAVLFTRVAIPAVVEIVAAFSDYDTGVQRGRLLIIIMHASDKCPLCIFVAQFVVQYYIDLVGVLPMEEEGKTIFEGGLSLWQTT